MACHKNLPVQCPDHNHDHHGHHHDHCHHDQFCGCINIATGAADSATSSAMAASNSALLAQKILQNCLSDKAIKPGGGLKYDLDTCPGEGGIYVFCPDLIQCGGGLAVDKNGDLYVNLADLIRPGTGLVVGDDGKLTFDSNSMDTTAFENLLKKLRLPKWLTSDMDLYVDCNSDGDSLVDGRGTRDMPFKSIQPCVNYACENYNVGDFTLNIHVAAGTYPEVVMPKSFARSGGKMCIVGTGNVTIAPTGHINSAILGNDGSWFLENLTVNFYVDTNTDDLGGTSAIFCINKCQMEIKNVHINATQAYGNSSGFACLSATNGGSLSIVDDCSITAKVTAGSESHITAISAYNGGIGLCWDNPMHIDGSYKVVAEAYHGGNIDVIHLKPTKFTGNATGKRYSVSSHGIITAGDRDYFPGSIAGSVDSDSFGIYE